MLQWRNCSLAVVLGLMMSLTLFTSGAFAQNVHQSQTGTKTQVAAGSTSVMETNQALPFTQTQLANHQRAVAWKHRLSQSITCAGRYRASRVYQRGRWVYVCRRF